MIRFERAPAPPAHLRAAYLDGLPEPQELFMESLVQSGTTWVCGSSAYAVECGGKLVELYVAPSDANRIVDVFDAAMTASSASRVLCKSFDTQLTFAALSRAASVMPSALLFRKIANPAFAEREHMSIRRGSIADAGRVHDINDGFFDSLDEIRSYAEGDGLFLLEEEGALVGCGIGKPVIADRPDIDVGMLVATGRRREGLGAHIVAFLKHHYLSLGLRPICGCSIDNIGSQRALMRAGFVSEHRLLEITY